MQWAISVCIKFVATVVVKFKYSSNRIECVESHSLDSSTPNVLRTRLFVDFYCAFRNFALLRMATKCTASKILCDWILMGSVFCLFECVIDYL